MIWSSASDFFAMGGYGLFVWGSYGTAFAIFLIEPWLAARRHRLALRAAREIAREGAHAPAPGHVFESVATGGVPAAQQAHRAEEARS